MVKKIFSLLLFYSAFVGIYAQKYEWKVIGKMTNPVWGAQAVNDPSSVNYNYIYVLGGYSNSVQDTVDWIQECYVPTNNWGIVGHMTQPRKDFIADIWKSSILYLGGTESLSNPKENLESVVFKPTFQSPNIYASDSNFARSSATGYIRNDNYYIIGGDPIDGSPYKNLPFIVEYNLNTKQYGFSYDYTSSDKPGNHMSFMIGDNIYIFGGVSKQGTLLSTISRFNIKTKSLEKLPTKLQTGIVEGAAVYNPLINTGFIIGGQNESNKPLSTVWQVTINNDGSLNISEFPSLKYPRRRCMAVNYGKFVAVMGGLDADNKVVPWVEILVDTSTVTAADENIIPGDFKLSQNYPNPFNPSTLINFYIPKETHVSLKVFDVLGREVATLVNETKSIGNHSVTFDASGVAGAGITSGIYYYRLIAGDFSETKKMVLMR
jgi:hypothetical protein